MHGQIESMLDRYESGHISRRTFVEGIAGFLLAPVTVVGGEPPAPVFKAVNLNHVTLAVSDLARTGPAILTSLCSA